MVERTYVKTRIFLTLKHVQLDGNICYVKTKSSDAFPPVFVIGDPIQWVSNGGPWPKSGSHSGFQWVTGLCQCKEKKKSSLLRLRSNLRLAVQNRPRYDGRSNNISALWEDWPCIKVKSISFWRKKKPFSLCSLNVSFIFQSTAVVGTTTCYRPSELWR